MANHNTKNRNGKRQCSICRKWKAANTDHFYQVNSKGALRSECIDCNLVARRVSGHSRPRRPVVDGKRQCKICDLWLPVDQHFHRNGNSYYSYCKLCRSEYDKGKRRSA